MVQPVPSARSVTYSVIQVICVSRGGRGVLLVAGSLRGWHLPRGGLPPGFRIVHHVYTCIMQAAARQQPSCPSNTGRWFHQFLVIYRCLDKAQSSFKLQLFLCSRGYAMDNLDEAQRIHPS